MEIKRDLLLYVDDEEQALKYFRMCFADDYEVMTANSADNAWPLIERHADRLALIISDQRMPGRSGVDLLTATKEFCPRVVRLLTTAFSDLASAIAAVNRGEIYAYITKPWQLDQLRVVVRQALQLHQVQCERDALLAEKIGVFQQLLLADRTRALGMAMSGLAGQVNRPLAAAAAWLRDREAVFALTTKELNRKPRDLWLNVLEQTKEITETASEVGMWLSRNRSTEDTVNIVELIASTLQGSDDITVHKKMLEIADIDSALLKAGVNKLVKLIGSQLPSPAASAKIIVQSADKEAVLTITINGGSQLKSDPDLDGLTAYLATYHHGCAIAVSSWSENGGEIYLTFAGLKDHGEEKFLAMLERLEQ